MKAKRTLLLVMLLCIGGMIGHAPLWAKKVEVAKAENVARHHLQAKSALRSSGGKLQLAKTAVRQRSGQLRSGAAGETVCYYVFNVNGGSNQGFIIVSGDDIARPVLGYSDNGAYDESNLPSNFVYWMDGLSQQIASAVENNAPQSTEAKAEWDSYLGGNSLRAASPVVGPLLQTQWNQSPIYNDLCPTINGGKALTGCVATAMAQIMKYYNHPAKGTGSSAAYTTETTGKSIPAVPFNVNYDWGNMINDYGSGTSPTNAQKTAVATLMYHCGVSVKMDYGLDGSAAAASDGLKALTTHFGYDNSIATKDRRYYNDAVWGDMLREQLDARLPVLYDGFDSRTNSGHAFVCDGYDNADKFHLNWGWGGSHDGYFVTTALNSGNGTYNENQNIHINIKPDEGGVPPPYELKLFKDNLTTSATAVDRGKSFTVNGCWKNVGMSPFSGGVGIAIVDNDDAILEIIGITQFTGSLASGYFFNSDVNCAVSSAITPGSYKLRAVVKPAGGSNWEIVTGAAGLVDKLDITVNEAMVPDNSDLKLYNGSNPAFVLTPNPISQGSSLSVEFGLLNNTGTGAFSGEIELGLYTNDVLVEVIEKRNLSVPNGNSYYTYTFNSSKITAAGGTYTMILYQKATTGVRKKVANYSTYLNSMEVTVNGTSETTAIETTGEADKIAVYPNPARDDLFIKSDTPIEKIEIFDISGRTVETWRAASLQQGNSQTINVSHLHNGIYFVKISGNGKIIGTTKLIKN
ncbi:hypothetical protein AGMMS4957_14640 [Bacteroidia bacterium]|nr:hypothetical protein AGMMS4957_14640 [Bacteroidia bacterium]